MKILDSQKNEVVSTTLSLNEDKQVVAHVSAGKLAPVDVFPVEMSMSNEKDGLEVAVNIPGSGLDPFYAVIEYSDVKTLKALPGKGLVSFALKAFR